MDKTPHEIWHQIFPLVMDTRSTRSRTTARTLIHLYSVSSQWRRAAIAAPALWTTLPVIDLESIGDDPHRIDGMKKLIDLFLANSGELPVSFHFDLPKLDHLLYEERAQSLGASIARSLLRERQRWKDAYFRVHTQLHLEGSAWRPSHAMPAPNLAKLVIDVAGRGGSVSLQTVESLLCKITPPSLVELEVHAAVSLYTPGEQARALCQAVRYLLRRSECPLTHLALSTGFSRATTPTLREILTLCPELRTLDIVQASLHDLETLIIHQSSLKEPPLVPKLQRLILRPDTSAAPYTSLSPGQGLCSVIQTRTRASSQLPGAEDRPQFEVRVHWENDAVLSRSVADMTSGFYDRFYRPKVLEASTLLHLMDDPGSVWSFDTASLDLAAKTFTALETGDVAEFGGFLTMANSGILKCLHSLAFKPAKFVPGDHSHSFRQRARSLCKKWQPLLIQEHTDLAIWRFRLCYVEKGVVGLTYRNFPGPGEGTIWDAVAEIGQTHPLARERVASEESRYMDLNRLHG